MYDRARYFTVTGAHLPGTRTTIEARATELAALHADLFGTSPEGVVNIKPFSAGSPLMVPDGH